MDEKRGQCRSLKEFDIRLYQDGSFQKLAKSQNLNSSGMFIDTDALLFSKGSILEIVFENFKGSERFKVEAKVVHRSLKGIGVEFQEIINQDVSFWQNDKQTNHKMGHLQVVA